MPVLFAGAARHRSGRMTRALGLALAALALLPGAGRASERCPSEQAEPVRPVDPAQCAALADAVRAPGKLPLDQYEAKLGSFLRLFCHRDEAGGWVRDKRVRDTGPFVARFVNGRAEGRGFGTHLPVLVWYSPEMVAWLRVNRAEEGPERAGPDLPVPDGAILVKEMYPSPAATCAGVDPARLKPRPEDGAAVMVRDASAAHDGWFWGWFGWDDWRSDWPAPATNAYPNMGFGQYCVNCHASARGGTFSALKNLDGAPGEPLVFLSQGLIPSVAEASPHKAATEAPPPSRPAPDRTVGLAFLARLGLGPDYLPLAGAVVKLPSEAYDSVRAMPKGHGDEAKRGFLTSDQCIGCHAAGSTGLQFDMTARGEDGLLVNLSPYATWRASPMGMAGRDPIFLAQLASETQSFHPDSAKTVEDACLGCHGVLGQRSFKAAHRQPDGTCASMSRAMLAATPFDAKDPFPALADYAGLARDGVSCMACHRMALGPEAQAAAGAPANACLPERRAFLNPGLTGQAARFTGSFEFGSGDTVKGQFEKPREASMRAALGMVPEHNASVSSSELCGSCHTVHLPILHRGRTVGHTYEQTTYAEWAFSAYRTGATPDGPLPAGAGAKAQSCQGCHMPSREADGRPTRSKIASIQEVSNFPQAEYTLGREALDLPEREGFARHTLVGLNVFFVRMARQFPDILGLRAQEMMLRDKAVDPLLTTERAMMEQAAQRTAGLAVSGVTLSDEALEADVAVTNRTGHKFPSGVGFRRAFLVFTVRDEGGGVLWQSGRTDASGIIVDRVGRPLPGELWWAPNCASNLAARARLHQPHRELIGREDEVQIYEDLAAAPADGAPSCDADTAEAGPLGALTTSFLSRCRRVKDNRLLPEGFLDRDTRIDIAKRFGAKADLAEEAGAKAVGDDPDYREGGGDRLRYRIPRADLGGVPVSVEAQLYYQATPPYYLQDRLCTARGPDTDRLGYLAAGLDLTGSRAEGWKLEIAGTGRVGVAERP